MPPRLGPTLALALASCAAAPPPPSVSARDPSNPNAEETPVLSPSVAMNATPMLAGVAAAGEASDAGVVYACPMHPDVTATEPGHRCPKCGMALVPRRSSP